MPDAPTLCVNGELLPYRPGDQVATILERLNAPANGVATALNGNFVPRPLRAQTPVHPGDQLTIFKAIVGG